MSGGEKKKKAGDRGHGWEEAGAEFYQESYPAAAIEADFQQAMQKDPSHIATLLPSKKSRFTTVTAKRIRSEPKTTLRRHTNTRQRGQSTIRRLSTNIQDAAVSMLPDLSENLSNEERTWEEIMQIKTMPISMLQKKQLKLELQSATKLRLQGFDQLKWKKRKAWQQLKIKLHETISKLELWGASLKMIGGNFGMGMVSYFLFIKWVFFLNLFAFSIIGLFLIIPSLILDTIYNDTWSVNITGNNYCSEVYWNKSRSVHTIVDFFHNSDFFEYSYLFYGAYTNANFEISEGFAYKIIFAYIGTIFFIFIFSFITILRSSAKNFRQRIIETEGQLYRYCNLVFGGWDYCINNDKAAVIKQKSLYNELKGFLVLEIFEEERQNKTNEEKFKLCLVRIFINTLVLLILCFCGIFIFYVLKISFEHIKIQDNIPLRETDNLPVQVMDQILFEFLPYICIVLLNIIIPVFFRYLITLESYSTPITAKLNLIRTIVLRLSLLGVLLISFYIKISGSIEDTDCTDDIQPLCWETFVGQQFLKLYITDIILQFFITFFINFPRSLIGRCTEKKVFKYVCKQEFDLSKHILDIVYLQTVCWMGLFFCPSLPFIAIIGSFLLFYVKKFTCLVNCTPSYQIHKASHSRFIFMLALLVGFIFIAIPSGYSIVNFTPSRVCGPFKNFDSIWDMVLKTFNEQPKWFIQTISIFSTATFQFPVFIIICSLLYYYYAVANANKNMVTVLKNQLVLEGHDKQFLLNRLSAFIKQQQEQAKYQENNDYS